MNRRHDNPARRRGSVYLAVLGASMIVTILGVAGLYAVRVQGKVTVNANNGVRAAAAANAAVELGRWNIRSNATWRADHTHNAWTTDLTFDGGAISYKLVDERDGLLNNNAAHAVRVYGKAAFGSALRIQSVELVPDSTGKMLPTAGSWRQEVLP